jgi:subtilisin family serine protease
MPVKILGADGEGTAADAVPAIYYAVANGADLISGSWGGAEGSNALRDAIAYAHDEGVVVVAAAGNNGSRPIIRLPIRRDFGRHNGSQDQRRPLQLTTGGSQAGARYCFRALPGQAARYGVSAGCRQPRWRSHFVACALLWRQTRFAVR